MNLHQRSAERSFKDLMGILGGVICFLLFSYNWKMDEQQGKGEIPVNEDPLKKIEQLYNHVPLLYKRFVLFQDVLLVIGGLKAATDYSLVGEVYKEEEFKQFRQALEEVGLKISTPIQGFDKYDNPDRKHGHLYDPLVLKAVTAQTEFALGYDGQMDFDQYINESVKAGYTIQGVLGKVYGFPESAIADYLSKDQNTKEFDSLEKSGHLKSTTTDTGNETYWYYGDAKPDVLEREQKKTVFLSNLNHSIRFKQIEQNPATEQSSKEWNKRVDDYFKSRKAEV